MSKKSSTRGAATGKRRKKGGVRGSDCSLKSMDTGAAARAEQARQLVLAEWSRIVEGLIGKAVEGGYQQAKLLFDLCKWTEAKNARLSDQRRAQLCDVLLEQLPLLPPREEKSEENGAGATYFDKTAKGAAGCEDIIDSSLGSERLFGVRMKSRPPFDSLCSLRAGSRLHRSIAANDCARDDNVC